MPRGGTDGCPAVLSDPSHTTDVIFCPAGCTQGDGKEMSGEGWGKVVPQSTAPRAAGPELREHWDTAQTQGQGLGGGAAWSWELVSVILMGSFQLGVFYDQAAGVPAHCRELD